MHDVTRPASGQEQAHDLPVSLPCNEQGRFHMTETYTIIQRNEYDSWRVIDVVHNLKEAQDLCAHYCDAAVLQELLFLITLDLWCVLSHSSRDGCNAHLTHYLTLSEA